MSLVLWFIGGLLQTTFVIAGREQEGHSLAAIAEHLQGAEEDLTSTYQRLALEDANGEKRAGNVWNKLADGSNMTKILGEYVIAAAESTQAEEDAKSANVEKVKADESLKSAQEALSISNMHYSSKEAIRQDAENNHNGLVSLEAEHKEASAIANATYEDAMAEHSQRVTDSNNLFSEASKAAHRVFSATHQQQNGIRHDTLKALSDRLNKEKSKVVTEANKMWRDMMQAAVAMKNSALQLAHQEHTNRKSASLSVQTAAHDQKVGAVARLQQTRKQVVNAKIKLDEVTPLAQAALDQVKKDQDNHDTARNKADDSLKRANEANEKHQSQRIKAMAILDRLLARTSKVKSDAEGLVAQGAGDDNQDGGAV